MIGEQTGDSEGDSYQPRFFCFVFFSASSNVAAHEGWVARAKQLIIVKAEKKQTLVIKTLIGAPFHLRLWQVD